MKGEKEMYLYTTEVLCAPVASPDALSSTRAFRKQLSQSFVHKIHTLAVFNAQNIYILRSGAVATHAQNVITRHRTDDYIGVLKVCHPDWRLG